MNDLIQEFAETITLARTAAGTWVNGAYVPGLTATSILSAVVLPLTPDQIVEMNLGERTKKAVVLYTTDPLQPSNEKTRVKADTITWDGDDYEVQSVVHRPQIEDLAHYRSTAIRVEASG